MNAAPNTLTGGIVDRSEDANYVRKFLASVRLIEGNVYARACACSGDVVFACEPL